MGNSRQSLQFVNKLISYDYLNADFVYYDKLYLYKWGLIMSYKFEDMTLGFKERAKALVGLLTVDEKISQMQNITKNWTK